MIVGGIRVSKVNGFIFKFGVLTLKWNKNRENKLVYEVLSINNHDSFEHLIVLVGENC